MSRGSGTLPTVTVVGLGPGPPSMLPAASRDALLAADVAFLRTRRHPAADGVGHLASFDQLYEEADAFEEVYRRIVDQLVDAARRESAAGRSVVYGVPGSPFVAEATVAMLRADPRISVRIVPAPSFLDLAWAALGIDPVTAGVQLIDGTAPEVELAGRRGPFLVAQCWSTEALSRLKLALDVGDPPRRVVLLHHLGLPDERVVELGLAELDQVAHPDHLTSLFVEESSAPVAGEMAQLDELVRTLRERCPWDREQTHASLTRHLIEETYEVLDAIAELTGRPGEPDPAAVDHLEEELGDLLFQVVFHARLAAEQGWFTLGDVARSVHDKLVGRHPHVFGDIDAPTPEAVMANWEVLKAAEKGRSSVTDGIPTALPALLLAVKVLRKGRSIGFEGDHGAIADALDRFEAERSADALGALLYSVAEAAEAIALDPEEALRATTLAVRDSIRAAES